MKNKKLWLLLSLGCILSGSFFLFTGTLLGGIPGFYLDRTGVHTSREAYEQKETVVQDTLEPEAFDSMDLDINYAEHVELIPSDRYAVEYRLFGFSEGPVCRVDNGRLHFEETPSALSGEFRIWFLYGGTQSGYAREPGPYYVKIEYPADQSFTDAVIRMESGDLKLPSLQADTLKIRNNYGNITLEGYDGTALEIHMSSGDLSLGSVAAQQTEIQNEYGEVLIGQVSGDRLTAELSSGSLLADLLDVTNLKVENEYGTVRVRLPEALPEYEYRLQTEYGSILLDGKKLTNSEEDEDEISYTSSGSNGRTVGISCESGDIIVDPAL